MINTFLNKIEGKSNSLKRKVIGLCINDGDYSLTDLSKELNTSIPTITKVIGELIDDGFVEEIGKMERMGNSGGRRPSIYGLNPSAGYFVGVDVRRHHLNIAVTNFKGKIVDFQEDIAFTLTASEESIADFCKLLKKHVKDIGIKDAVLAYGVNLTGRVNHETGYSFSYFLGEDKPITTILEEQLEAHVYVDNDSRVMAYGEYICGEATNEKNILFINMSWGLGMGMLINGKLAYGKSGYSGEIGHFPFLGNGILCQCGKIGCLETGASGSALHRIFTEKLKAGRASVLSEKYNSGEEISLEDILKAALSEDVLAIESIEEVGEVLGKALAGFINIFNPELVVIGGTMADVKDYLILPVKSAINKYSLTIVNKDTIIKFSKLGKKSGALGACMLSRSELIGLL